MDPRVQAEAYIKRHKVDKIFQDLGTALVYSRPENPREFLIQELRRLQTLRKSKRPVRAVDSAPHDAVLRHEDARNDAHARPASRSPLC